MRPLAVWLSASLISLATARAGAQENAPSPHPDVLALHRVELRPFGGWAVAPHSVTGAFVGADAAFRLTDVFALGADFALYGPFDRSAGDRPYPLNETLWSGDLDLYVVPWPAHARSGSAAGAFEPYLLAGLGALASQPVGVVDPAVRSFRANTLVDLSVGAGVRLFVGERVAISLELRDVMYFEKIENSAVASGPAIAPGQPGYGITSPLNPSTWYSPDSHLTNAFQLRLGASFFVLGG